MRLRSVVAIDRSQLTKYGTVDLSGLSEPAGTARQEVSDALPFVRHPLSLVVRLGLLWKCLVLEPVAIIFNRNGTETAFRTRDANSDTRLEVTACYLSPVCNQSRDLTEQEAPAVKAQVPR